MKTTETFYAVEVRNPINPNKRRLAGASLIHAGPHLHYFRAEAMGHKKQLGRKSARVVKVRATYTWS